MIEGVLKIQLTAPPLQDRANRQLLKFLAHTLDLPAHRISLVAGARSRHKTIGIEDCTEERLLEKLASHLARVSHGKS